jgi:hypothetical protein
MSDRLETNPILYFRNSNEFSAPSVEGVFNLVRGTHLNNENRFVEQSSILGNSTLITETREAVDSSEHS